jgi:hypothetical protein
MNLIPEGYDRNVSIDLATLQVIPTKFQTPQLLKKNLSFN